MAVALAVLAGLPVGALSASSNLPGPAPAIAAAPSGAATAQGPAAQDDVTGGSTPKETAADRPVRRAAALAGYVAYGLIALTVLWGILTSTGLARRSIRRRALYSGHMCLAVTTLAFSAMHAVAYMFQTGEQFGVLKVFVPFAQGGELEVAFGIVGLELMAAVAASIWIQRRLNYRRWHIVHYFAYPAYVLALLHTVTTSPEARSFDLLAVAVAATVLVLIAFFTLRALPATSSLKGHVAPVEP